MSLDGAYDRDNIFAKILRGDVPCAKVYEDEAVISFMDLFPQSRGHLLVVPKVACRNILDIPPDDLQALALRVQMLARAARKALEPDGLTIMQFNGGAGGQTVYHLHFHIIPRWDGVGLKGHGQSGMADSAELAELAKRIAANI